MDSDREYLFQMTFSEAKNAGVMDIIKDFPYVAVHYIGDLMRVSTEMRSVAIQISGILTSEDVEFDFKFVPKQ